MRLACEAALKEDSKMFFTMIDKCLPAVLVVTKADDERVLQCTFDSYTISKGKMKYEHNIKILIFIINCY